MNYILKNSIVFVCLVFFIGFLSTNCSRFSHAEQITSVDSIDLILDGRFVGYKDQLGSEIDISKPFVVNGILGVNYKLIPVLNNTYPWIDIQCFLDDEISWRTLDSIKLTYKSTGDVSVSLTQSVLLRTGESYRKVLKPFVKWHTVFLKPQDFAQPDWSENKEIDLDLNQVKSLGISPNHDDDSLGVSGFYEVKELIGYGLSKQIKKALISPIILNSINNNKLYYTVIESGDYLIQIKDQSNKVIMHVRTLVNIAGLNELFITKPISNGIYSVSITSAHHKIDVKCDVSDVLAIYKDGRY